MSTTIILHETYESRRLHSNYVRQGQPPNITTHVQATADVEPDVGVKRLHDSGRPDAWVDGNGNIHAGAGAPDSNTLAVLVRIAEGGGV